MRWKGERISPHLILLYVSTILLCIALASFTPRSPFEEDAVPVFGDDYSHDPKPAEQGISEVLDNLTIPISFYQSILSHGLPKLREIDDGDVDSGISWLTGAENILYALTDVRLSEPLSYLRATYPMLSLVVPPGPGTQPSYVMHVPTRTEESEEEDEPDPRGAKDDPDKVQDERDLWLGTDEPKVLIYHTHTQESFWNSVRKIDDDPRDPFTDDEKHNMLRVGEEMAAELTNEYGVGVIHVRDYFDTLPDGEGMNRVGAYARSGDRVASLLDKYPSVSLVLDVHRDATPREVTAYETDHGETWARIMIVLGTDRHLDHPNWEENVRVADEMIDTMEHQYPGLYLRTLKGDYRYNQHLSPGALLLEIGGVENTMQEALKSAKMMAHVIAIMLDEERVD